MSLLLALQGITATLTQTEQEDSLTAVAVLAIQATASITEAEDTLSSTAVLAIQADLNVTEAGDVLSSSAVLAIQASLTVTEASDTANSAAVLAIQVSLNVTEASDTLSSTAVLGILAAPTAAGGAGHGRFYGYKKRGKPVNLDKILKNSIDEFLNKDAVEAESKEVLEKLAPVIKLVPSKKKASVKIEDGIKIDWIKAQEDINRIEQLFLLQEADRLNDDEEILMLMEA